MSKLRISLLKSFNYLGDHSGCHQLPQRSFCVGGYIFPICARCTGVAVGQVAALIVGLAGARVPVVYCVALLGLMGLDWGVQYVGLHESNNGRRFVTGICGGFGLFQLYFLLLDWTWATVRTMLG